MNYATLYLKPFPEIFKNSLSSINSWQQRKRKSKLWENSESATVVMLEADTTPSKLLKGKPSQAHSIRPAEQSASPQESGNASRQAESSQVMLII